MIPVRRRVARRLLAGAACASLVAAGGLLTPGAASAGTALSRSATSVRGYCSEAGGFETNLAGTVARMSLTVSPAAPRAGQKVLLRVSLRQSQRTNGTLTYPAGILRGEVVVGIGAASHLLVGPVNARALRGPIFPSGWTASATVTAPARGRYAVEVDRIVYDVRGGGSGGWGPPYAGFDLVCSGGKNPTAKVTPYARPRLTLAVRA